MKIDFSIDDCNIISKTYWRDSVQNKSYINKAYDERNTFRSNPQNILSVLILNDFAKPSRFQNKVLKR